MLNDVSRFSEIRTPSSYPASEKRQNLFKASDCQKLSPAPSMKCFLSGLFQSSLSHRVLR